jgi:hypothetical protein
VNFSDSGMIDFVCVAKTGKNLIYFKILPIVL